ncbi:MAG: glycoside hydrolase, partial [Pseudopedobacter saltans]
MLKKYLFIVTTLFVANGVFSQINTKPFVIPSIQKWDGKEGQLQLKENYIIVADKNDSSAWATAQILASDFSGLGIKSSISPKVSKDAVTIYLKTAIDTSLKQEGYRLDISDNIEISAPYYKGLIWGTRTLLQLIEQAKKHNTGLAKGTAIDLPQYPSRGFILDDGRKFFSLEFLKRYIKMLS